MEFSNVTLGLALHGLWTAVWDDGQSPQQYKIKSG